MRLSGGLFAGFVCHFDYICGLKAGSIGQLAGDCQLDLVRHRRIDIADLEIMASEWLASGAGLEADLDSDEKVDFKVFAENRLREQ